jgi:1-acyl-sn-glycerol-3-phosphate acyltransferase
MAISRPRTIRTSRSVSREDQAANTDARVPQRSGRQSGRDRPGRGRTVRTRPSAHLAPYRLAPPSGIRFLHRTLFWIALLVETLGRRRLSVLVDRRLGYAPQLRVLGAEHLPASGPFVVAANHFSGGPALDATAAVLTAVDQARPDLADRWMLVAGMRPAPERMRNAPLGRTWLRGRDWVFRRWSRNVLRVPLGGPAPSIRTLRAWRRRVALRPAFVFPEGRSRLVFGPVRPGAGRWLAALPAPTVPVAVWWYGGAWRVRFGPAIPWSARPELRDLQVGLAIARLLPPPLRGEWQAHLDKWESAQQARGPAGRAHDALAHEVR